MSNPTDLKYTESHEWVRIDGDEATVGITAHAAQSLSDLVFLELPETGDSLSAGESFGEIESVKAVSELKSPVSGDVSEANNALEDSLSDINEDPYGKGWMVKVKVSSTVDGLMDAEAYEKFIAANA
jgi:glycine cleavage system H protein